MKMNSDLIKAVFIDKFPPQTPIGCSFEVPHASNWGSAEKNSLCRQDITEHDCDKKKNIYISLFFLNETVKQSNQTLKTDHRMNKIALR